nr:retrovirus-related Pol polyprotein from transposon TNT 1-94 [Tanacetum cinerariifolium]
MALSTTEAEYMAPTEAVKEAIWLKGLLEELGLELNTMAVNCDNQGAIHLSRNHVFHERTKHINVRYHFIREVLEAKTVKVLKVGTEHNVADALTKVKHILTLTPESNREIRSRGKVNNVLFLVRDLLNKFTWYKNGTLNTRITIYSGQTRFDLIFVLTSWRHAWDPTLGITLRRMSAMANTTPIVTTVTKPVTNPRDADATPRVNTQDFCEEYYEDILPIIMDKVRRDNRKEVHAMLDFGEGFRERTREGMTSSRDHSRGRTRPHRLNASNEDRLENRGCFRGIGESYDNSHSSYETGINHGYRYHDRDRSRHIKMGRDSESPLSSVSKSDSSDGRHRKSK